MVPLGACCAAPTGLKMVVGVRGGFKHVAPPELESGRRVFDWVHPDGLRLGLGISSCLAISISSRLDSSPAFAKVN